MEIAKEAIGIIIDGDMEIGFEYIDSRRDKIALWWSYEFEQINDFAS